MLGLSLQPLKFLSTNKDTGADITVAHKLYKNTTISSDGYILITWVCKMLRANQPLWIL